ncbi:MULTISPECIES: putative quinol monooxygenase [Gottfriedia]|uniref:Monooxygenase n=1 Tax=Gottfriedia solisilvae TaxID=1516104 RepID=A0A8J3EY23_9BACI|nr:putative quinol monooxygenase [Gottfriedia solisilvae]GGI12871.1 monooxygenase [Gottfriedia solisilvae]
MIIIHAEFHLNKTKEENFLKDISDLVKNSRKENGNISYNLYKEIEKDNIFTMVEVWEDMVAVESHNKSEHFTSFVTKAKDYFVAPLKIKIFDGRLLKD